MPKIFDEEYNRYYNNKRARRIADPYFYQWDVAMMHYLDYMNHKDKAIVRHVRQRKDLAKMIYQFNKEDNHDTENNN